MLARRILAIAGTLALGAGLLCAEINGKYKVEMERPPGAQGGGPGGGGGGGGRGGMFGNVMFDLKEAGGALTGTVQMGAGEQTRSVEISNGKIADGKFSFETKMETQRGEFVMVYEGTVEGNTLKGTRTIRDVDRPPMNFTATKAE